MESSNAFAVTLTLPLAMASAVPQGISYTGLRQQLSREEWEDLKSTIRKLYIDENRTFSYIKEFLVKGHNFRPTKKQFSDRTKMWGFEKNMKRSERGYILQTLGPVEQDVVVDIAGRKHNRLKLERWRKELNLGNLGNGLATGPTTKSANSNSAPSSALRTSTTAIVSEPLDTMEIDDDEPVIEVQREPKVWVRDDEFKHLPFASWANVDVIGSPKLSRLFEKLKIEAEGLPDDIDALVLPDPVIKVPTSSAKEFISCSELVIPYRNAKGSSSISANYDTDWFDEEATKVPQHLQVGANFSDGSRTLMPFKFPNSDAWLPSGVQIGLHISPFNELYPFPSSLHQSPRKFQKSHTLVETYRMKERDCIRKLEQLNRAGLRENHPVVLGLMTRLADAYYDQDKDKDAEMLYRKILSVQQISEESQSEANLWVQFDLIECISFQSRYVEAKEMLKRVYAAIAGKFASHHPIFRRYLNVKATILDSTENYEEKEDISRDVIQLCLVHLGPRHPSTLDAIYRLGVTLWARNKYFESEQLQRIAIYFYQEGTEVLHDICWSMINLGRVFEGQNRLEDATRLYSLAFEKAKEGLGDEHRTTMLSCYHLGRLLREMGSLQESEELLRTTCALQIRVLGEEHPNSLWTMCHLGETLRQRVKYEESVSLLEECFQKCLDLLELDYRLTGACCDYLGLCYEDQERYGDALALYHKAVDKIRGAGEIGIWRVEGFQDRIERIYLEMEDGYDEEENPQSE